MAGNSRFFKVDTIEQFKILRYINVMFREEALELELLNDNTIRGTDRNGNKIYLYFDYKTQKVKVDE